MQEVDSSPIVGNTSPVLVSTPRVRTKLCDVRNCGTNSVLNPELLFVPVPGHGNPERRFLWMLLMQPKIEKQRSYVCSRHFKIPDDFKDISDPDNLSSTNNKQASLKRNVVPHLNLPTVHLPMPALKCKWPLTLPDSLTKAGAYNSNATDRPHLVDHGYRLPFNSGHGSTGVKISKAVQTECDRSVPSERFRSVPPSLQYCRLCFNRQDLEPIFTADQTLIEPDLIENIYKCTEITVTLNYDFPSSICSACYKSVQDFDKFRKLVQANDVSLRTAPGSSETDDVTGSLMQNSTVVRTKMTATNNPRCIRTVPAASLTTPSRDTQEFRAPHLEDDSLLEVRRVEDVATYARRQQTIERNQTREQRMQDSFYPVPYRRIARPPEKQIETTRLSESVEGDPLVSTDVSVPPSISYNSSHGLVPVTLIKGPSEPIPVALTASPGTQAIVQKEEKADSTSPRKFIKLKPLSELTAKANVPFNVLQAVKLVPKSGEKKFDTPNSVPRTYSTVQKIELPKNLKSIGSKTTQPPRNAPKIKSGIKFPSYALNKLFSKRNKNATSNREVSKEKIATESSPKGPLPVRKPSSAKTNEWVRVKATTELWRSPSATAPKLQTSTDKPQISPSSAVSKLAIPSGKQEVFKEVKSPEATTQAKQKTNAPETPTQKQTNIPKNPSSESTPPVSVNVPVVLVTPLTTVTPRASRVHRKPLKYQDGAEFPKPSKTNSTKSESENKEISPVASDTSSSKAPSSRSKEHSSEKLPKVQNSVSLESTSPVIEIGSSKKVPSARPPTKRKSILGSLPKEQPPVKRMSLPECQINISLEDQRRSLPDSQPNVQPIEYPKKITLADRRKSLSEQTVALNSLPTNQKATPQVDKRKSGAPKLAKEQPAESQKKTTLADRRKSMSDQTVPQKSLSEVQKKVPQMDKRKSLPDSQAEKIPPKQETKKPSSDESIATSEAAPPVAQQQQQRPNGSSRKSAPTEIPVRKKKEVEPKTAAPVVSSQDWKCPFCPDKVYDQKKLLVKHLRKRHGMDYALVRQRLAIYGGNWR